MDYQIRSFLKKMLDSSDIRTTLERLIGYDEVAAAREVIDMYVLDERIVPLARFLVKVCEEVEKHA